MTGMQTEGMTLSGISPHLSESWREVPDKQMFMRWLYDLPVKKVFLNASKKLFQTEEKQNNVIQFNSIHLLCKRPPAHTQIYT